MRSWICFKSGIGVWQQRVLIVTPANLRKLCEFYLVYFLEFLVICFHLSSVLIVYSFFIPAKQTKATATPLQDCDGFLLVP